jgi:dihydroorotate dehydrogenase
LVDRLMAAGSHYEDTAIAMANLYPLIRPVLRQLPAEVAHNLTVRALQAGLGRFMIDRAAREPDPPILAQRLWGLNFPNPVGLAAGFDKNARVPEAMRNFGFGFVEIGTVTPRPQPGNPKPRLFRLEGDQAIVNRMGFNSGGIDAAIDRLHGRPRTAIVGINLGKNRNSRDAVLDYAEGIRRAAKVADYLVVNISSPNTPGLRDLQRRASLRALLVPLLRTREECERRVPLLVKISPDLTPKEREDIATIALDAGIDGLIVSNTTVDRPAGLVSRYATEAGGLSGRPLFAASTSLLADMYRLTQGGLPMIGVGGVASGADAYQKIRSGACLVQLYTALVFMGPSLVTDIKKELAELLQAEGFTSVAEAVGAAARSRSISKRAGASSGQS